MQNISPLIKIQPVSHVTADLASREERRQHLRVDQVIRASVAEGGEDHVTLEFGQERFRAETKLPLRSGQTLELLVVATTPHVELRVLGDSLGERLSQYLQILNGKWNFLFPAGHIAGASGTQVEHLNPEMFAFLEAWRLSSEGLSRSPSGEALRNIISFLGLNHESDLAREDLFAVLPNLKSALLQILHKEGGSGSEAEEMVKQQLQLLELFQLSLVRLGAQGMSLYPLPLPFLDQGFLLTQKKNGEDEAESSPRVSLHLHLGGLGDLRIDLLDEGEGTFVRFACEGQEKADYVSLFREELEQALESLPLERLTFSVGVKRPDQVLIEMLQPEEGGFLDMRA